MRINRTILIGLASLLLIAASFGSRATARQSDDELFPCDPTPSQVRICLIRGGTFNFATCRCEFP